jgi:arsenate reductase
MQENVIYYNPKCQTCRSTLEILQKKGIHPRVVEYLKNPPTEKELSGLLDKLGIEPGDLVRKKEPFYQKNLAGKSLSRAEWLKTLHENPVLIERPIVVIGARAIVARPPEKVKEIL